MAIKEFVIETKKLKTEYDKIKKSRFGWLQVLFFPRALKSALENPNSSSLDIVAAAFKSTWFFHLWFFPKTLRSFFKSDYVKSGQWLFGNQINLSKFDDLTKDFQTQEKDTLASVLCSLHDASDKTKSERNLDLIKQHKNATHVLHAILISNKHNDFDGNDRQTKINHIIQGLESMTANNIFKILQKTNLLDIKHKKNNLMTIFTLGNVEFVGKNISLAVDNNLLNNDDAQANFDKIIEHPNNYGLNKGLIFLISSNALSQSNFSKIIANNNPDAEARKIMQPKPEPQKPATTPNISNPQPASSTTQSTNTSSYGLWFFDTPILKQAETVLNQLVRKYLDDQPEGPINKI